MNDELRNAASKIKLLVLDVDGVLTDGSINVSDAGEIFKSFNVKDGLGIKLLQKTGVEIAIITGRTSGIVEKRASELGIKHVFQGRIRKKEVFIELAENLGIGMDEVAYMGDDLPDLAVMRLVGLPTTPLDGMASLEPYVKWRASVPGGRGAVRELAELILSAKGQWNSIFEEYLQ